MLCNVTHAKEEEVDMFDRRTMEEASENNDDESEEKHNMKRQKMSQVWEHFRLYCKVNTVPWICCNTALVYHNSSISNEDTQNGVNNLRHHQLTSFSSFNLFSSSFIRFSSSFLRFSSCFALKHNHNIPLAHSNI